MFFDNQLSELFVKYELELLGVLDIVDGLEYHYKNFRKIEKKYIIAQEQLLKEHIYEPVLNPQYMIHEATAYLNRLGQIETLFTSEWFKNYMSAEELVKYCPIIFALMPFRNKFTAHRSIDDPRNETPSQMASHASIPLGISSRGKVGERPNVNYTIKVQRAERENPKKTPLAIYQKSPIGDIEFFTEDEVFLTFIPTKHHQKICLEIVTVLKASFEKSFIP